jgi:redox-sensing transcriptional repressor
MIRIGIIATPAEAAQGIADQMVAGGIKAIWNFSPMCPKVPQGVMVRNMDLSSDFIVLSHYIHNLSTHRIETGIESSTLTDTPNEKVE